MSCNRSIVVMYLSLSQFRVRGMSGNRVAIMSRLTRVDAVLFHWLFGKMASRDGKWMKILSKTGDGYLYLILALLLWSFEPNHGKVFM